MRNLRQLRSAILINNKAFMVSTLMKNYTRYPTIGSFTTYNLCNDEGLSHYKNEPVSVKSFATSFDLISRNFSVSSNVFSKSKDRGKDKKKPSKPKEININELAEVINVEHLTSQMEKALEDLKNSFIKNLTLRSTTGSIEEIPVTYEGKEYKLQELVQISRKPKTVVFNVSAFPQVIPQIIQAIAKSGLNLNPQQDGTTLFIPIPKVTKEHREGLSKNAKSLFIKCRDHIKDIQNKEIKKIKKKTELSQDLSRNVQGQIQTLADKYVSEAEKILEAKTKELLGE
ncbi:ribosome-recycling factor, mitochondrial [Cephus cinctus]|uniref:Ribosome-recycling factor, mitochondrial n=1 Tax=Cephus cinctus TaxID=211228 RepID=A0AAJ7CEE5_CEPCN|nr:ribosome-recycling factor, mitochondrial [Cephus cinctus]